MSDSIFNKMLWEPDILWFKDFKHRCYGRQSAEKYEKNSNILVHSNILPEKQWWLPKVENQNFFYHKFQYLGHKTCIQTIAFQEYWKYFYIVSFFQSILLTKIPEDKDKEWKKAKENYNIIHSSKHNHKLSLETREETN